MVSTILHTLVGLNHAIGRNGRYSERLHLGAHPKEQ
jgi:hypothetical protein